MKSQILLKHTGSLDQYPYARYVYTCIVQYFQANGGQVIQLPSGKFKPAAGEGPKLWVIDIPVSGGFTGKWSQMVQLPRLLKKINAELIIQLGWDMAVLPKTTAPKWLIIPEIDGFTSADKPGKKELMRRTSLSRQIIHAKKGLIYAPEAKTTVREVIGQNADTPLDVWIPYPQNALGALSWEEKESIKDLYTDGNEYFLIDAASADQAMIIHYLKAFSHFKKWQKSAMKLLLLITATQLENEAFQELFSSFHFREDVVLKPVEDRSIRHDLIAAAYAVLEPSDRPGHLVTLLEAVQYGSLAVGMSLPGTAELLGEALFAIPGNGFQEIGQTMITIYKSEILRTRHIKASEKLAASFQPKDWTYWMNKAATAD